MKSLKLAALWCLIMTLILGVLCPSVATAAREIGVFLNGVRIDFPDQGPISKSGSVYVPVRFVSESLSATVTWVGSTQTVTITKGNSVIVLALGANYATVDGGIVTLTAPAESVSGRVMVPLRFVSEVLGATVTWNAQEYAVYLTAETEAPTVEVLSVEEYRQAFSPFVQNTEQIKFVVRKRFDDIPHLVGLVYRSDDYWDLLAEIIVLRPQASGYELLYRENVEARFGQPSTLTADGWGQAFALDTDDRLLIETQEAYPSEWPMCRYILLDDERVLHTDEGQGDTRLVKYGGKDNLATGGVRSMTWYEVDIQAADFDLVPRDVHKYVPEFDNQDYLVEVTHFQDIELVSFDPIVLKGNIDLQLTVENTALSQRNFKYAYPDDYWGEVYTYTANLDTKAHKRIIVTNRDNFAMEVACLSKSGQDVESIGYPGWFEVKDLKPGETYEITFYAYERLFILQLVAR